MMDWISDLANISGLLFALDLLVRFWLIARIIRRRLPSGVAWAWICLVLFLPVFGTILYLTFGEYRQARRRQERLSKSNSIIQSLAKIHQDNSISDQAFTELAPAFQSLCGFPVLRGNKIQLQPDSIKGFQALMGDIAQAKVSIDLEFYIWSDGGLADEFGRALGAAAGRGVKCRLIVDAIGSAAFIRGPAFSALKAAGVQIVVALPSGLWRSLFARPDLRIHRKIAVIDSCIAYTGSMNLADPKFFNLKTGAAPWVDALARIEGPAVAELFAVFLSDWCAETGESFAEAVKQAELKEMRKSEDVVLQCLPSGPAVKNSAIEQVLLMAMGSARGELVVTTPYFLPSEALLYALTTAARRGTRTVLIIPEKVDSRLVHHASRSFFEDLLLAGVEIYLFRGGLLHTKSITVDGQLSLFGSLNFDPRSLRINFEITMAIFDKTFGSSLRQLQEQYINNSQQYTLDEFSRRRASEVWAGDLARLVGPLL